MVPIRTRPVQIARTDDLWDGEEIAKRLTDLTGPGPAGGHRPRPVIFSGEDGDRFGIWALLGSNQ